MTSISIIAGNIPLALALEPGSTVRASLGTVVIGGITSSLILTLLLVPIMYTILAPDRIPGGPVDDTSARGKHDETTLLPRLPAGAPGD
jgi:hypothetical protein